MYLDDGLCAVAGRLKALVASELVRTTLARAGFVVHLIKSIWVGMWWSMAPVFHLASGRLRRLVRAPHGVSSWQCGECYCL